jgi:hypothetical protein
MRKITLLPVAVAALATIAPITSAGAAPRPKVDLAGPGTHVVATDGSAAVTGQATGRPFDGAYSATLAAADGTLPAPGVCEPGTVSVLVDGPGRKHLTLAATGDVCGQHVDESFVVTQVFGGTYEVLDAAPRNLTGSDGFLEVRLEVDGGASLLALDT